VAKKRQQHKNVAVTTHATERANLATSKVAQSLGESSVLIVTVGLSRLTTAKQIDDCSLLTVKPFNRDSFCNSRELLF
jgi:hypothetical protein